MSNIRRRQDTVWKELDSSEFCTTALSPSTFELWIILEEVGLWRNSFDPMRYRSLETLSSSLRDLSGLRELEVESSGCDMTPIMESSVLTQLKFD